MMGERIYQVKNSYITFFEVKALPPKRGNTLARISMER